MLMRLVLVGRCPMPVPWDWLVSVRVELGMDDSWVPARQKQPDTDCEGWRESDRAVEERGGEREREDRRAYFMMQG